MLIALEGLDGAGKRTQSKLLGERLESQGLKVRHYSYPNYDRDYGKLLRRFLDGGANMNAEELFLVYLADMVKDKEKIKQDLEDGAVVIMDRYFHSTVAYQSAGGFGYERAKRVEEIFDLPKPDIVFYFEVPPITSMRRKEQEKGQLDRHEGDNALLEKTKLLYHEMMKEGFGAKKWVFVDASRSIGQVHETVFAEVNTALKGVRVRV